MHYHTDKSQKQKNQSGANTDAQKQSTSQPTFQFVDNRPEAVAQGKLQEIVNNSPQAVKTAQLKAMTQSQSIELKQKKEELVQKKENKTGLPDQLKAGVENLSGHSLDDVKVHRNSDKPAQMQAHAYAQGTDIHLGPGQEKHLSHEAWHVVQQKQGRVKPTTQLKGKANINDDVGLEKEADVMGEKALSIPLIVPDVMQSKLKSTESESEQKDYPVQRQFTSATMQLFSVVEADELIRTRFAKRRQWYFTEFIPAMQVIAQKQGQTYDQYLAATTHIQFLASVEELLTNSKDERSYFEMASEKVNRQDRLVPSEEYVGKSRVHGTNILIQAGEAGYQDFVDKYKSGNLVWYRGLSVSHFSYGVLRESGVLASEGTADTPTFTMDNPNPHRWLPGIDDPALAQGLAITIPAAAAGMREIMTRKAIPVGAVLRFSIISPAPVAYLNYGEQVIRGPILGATCHVITTLGPLGPGTKAGVALSDLPPAAPYNAAVGSAEVIAWEAAIDEWMVNH